MQSAAYAKFGERILEVKRLLTLCAPNDADFRIRKEHLEKDGAILRGAHVLLCSHLEGYFEDLIADIVTAYDELASSIEELPDVLRAHQVLGAASRWDVKDQAKRWANVRECTLHPLMQDAHKMPPKCMDSELHTRGFANPGTEEIRALFETVGLADVWTLFTKIEPDKLYTTSVDIIVHRRNQIAHGKTDATITLSDANIYVQRAERVAEVFDLVVTQHLNLGLSLADCWAALEASRTKNGATPSASEVA